MPTALMPPWHPHHLPEHTPFPAKQRTAGTVPRAPVGDLQRDIWAVLFQGHPDILKSVMQRELREVYEAKEEFTFCIYNLCISYASQLRLTLFKKLL